VLVSTVVFVSFFLLTLFHLISIINVAARSMFVLSIKCPLLTVNKQYNIYIYTVYIYIYIYIFETYLIIILLSSSTVYFV